MSHYGRGGDNRYDDRYMTNLYVFLNLNLFILLIYIYMFILNIGHHSEEVEILMVVVEEVAIPTVAEVLVVI